MNIIDAIMGKNMAIDELLKNGGVGYTESGQTILDVDLVKVDDAGLMAYEEFPTNIRLVEGKTYTITTNSGTYTEKCISLYDGGVNFIGNPRLIGLADTGQSFCVYVAAEDEDIVCAAFDYNGSSHMTVSEAETVHTIDPMYMPVVEITSADYPAGELPGTSVSLSEEESAQLSAFAKAKVSVPIRLKVNAGEMGTMEICGVFNYMNFGGMNMYQATLTDIDMAFIDEGGGNWYMGD